MGAFVGLEDIIEKRFSKTKSIGFTSSYKSIDLEDSKNPLDDLIPTDLKKFGLIPELIGRFPVITHTNHLTKEDLVRIITEPKNSISEFEKAFLSALSFVNSIVQIKSATWKSL